MQRYKEVKTSKGQMKIHKTNKIFKILFSSFYMNILKMAVFWVLTSTWMSWKFVLLRWSETIQKSWIFYQTWAVTNIVKSWNVEISQNKETNFSSEPSLPRIGPFRRIAQKLLKDLIAPPTQSDPWGGMPTIPPTPGCPSLTLGLLL